MATYTTYDTVGVKEDVSDVISNISPTKTPFQSAIGTEKVTQRTPQWQEDSLAAEADNAQVEGFDATDGTQTATTMRDNTTQIFSKTIKVSGTTDATSFYGRAKESAYQMAKVSAEVKRDLERTLIGIVQAKTVGTSGVARRMSNSWSQIAGGVTTTTDSDAGTGGNQVGPLTEANLLANMQLVYDAGGDIETIMVKPKHAATIANFAYASGRLRDIGSGKTVMNAVDLYVSPYGQARVVLNRFQIVSDVLLFAPENWKLLVLRNWFREVLAKTGDNVKQMIVGEFSLKHENQSASGRITNLS